ncbi:MAG: hypothetical protein HY079_03435 [Elusimicrobia bacterium]|nr:hypothetical protein [Elusimicrobiota bacterium]
MTRPLAAAAAALLAAAAASAQNGVSKPFMSVELRMAPFQGAVPAATRKKVEAFVSGAGYKLLSYQDNEAVGSVELEFPGEPDGLLASIRARIAKSKAMNALRARPGVSEVFEYGNSPRVGVRFEPALYRPAAETLLSALPPGVKTIFILNPRMRGVWARLDVTGVSDPRAAAAEFARRHPAEVLAADIRVELEVLRIETH